MMRQTTNSIPKELELSNTPDNIAYPRTGKRGVPQQFPRRLYIMLHTETEDRTVVEGCDEPLIQWSKSGRAFHISNIDLFSSHVLPKYFRTSKFSSFQRNLNLYGFSKVRKGPDMDMYAHPSFIQNHPELLSQLKKCRHGGNATKKSKQNRNTDRPLLSLNDRMGTNPGSFAKYNSTPAKSMGNQMTFTQDECQGGLSFGGPELNGSNSRVVSPCHSTFTQGNPHATENVIFDRSQASFVSINANSLSQVARNLSISPNMIKVDSNSQASQGKLGLLALAVECLAD